MPIPPLRHPIFDTKSKSAPTPSGRRAYNTPGINNFVQANKVPVQDLQYVGGGRLKLSSLASIHETCHPEDPDKSALLRWDKLTIPEKRSVLDRILYLLNSKDLGIFRLAPITHESDGIVVINTLCAVLAEAKNIIYITASENSAYHGSYYPHREWCVPKPPSHIFDSP